ncbi:MAG TPA: alpha-E domain-containing protein [Acidimicrobiia bacterium]|jgi:uncharacterized alpha-E superfamily protein
MLSRIAESLYWIGRYVERAEDTARILDVHFHLLVEDSSTDVSDACRSLLEAMGVHDGSVTPDGASVAALLTHDTAFPSSIVVSVDAAWDNARGAREAISSELWECLNVTRQQVRAWEGVVAAPHAFLGWVKGRTALAAGVVDTTMNRDDGWRFLVLGRSLERADMTIRLLSARYGERWGDAGWQVLLRCCSGHEAFLRRSASTFDPERALAFLVADEEFPRSMLAAVREAEHVLSEIEHQGRHGRGVGDARRLLGRAASELAYATPLELASSLPDRLASLELLCSASHDEVARRYFRSAAAIEWSA